MSVSFSRILLTIHQKDCISFYFRKINKIYNNFDQYNNNDDYDNDEDNNLTKRKVAMIKIGCNLTSVIKEIGKLNLFGSSLNGTRRV